MSRNCFIFLSDKSVRLTQSRTKHVCKVCTIHRSLFLEGAGRVGRGVNHSEKSTCIAKIRPIFLWLRRFAVGYVDLPLTHDFCMTATNLFSLRRFSSDYVKSDWILIAYDRLLPDWLLFECDVYVTVLISKWIRDCLNNFERFCWLNNLDRIPYNSSGLKRFRGILCTYKYCRSDFISEVEVFKF